jgi:hypothetical protein
LKNKYLNKKNKFDNLKKKYNSLKKNYKKDLENINKELENTNKQINEMKEMKKNKKLKNIINKTHKIFKNTKKIIIDNRKDLNKTKKISINKKLYDVYRVKIYFYVQEKDEHGNKGFFSEYKLRNNEHLAIHRMILRNDVVIGIIYDESSFHSFLNAEERKNFDKNYANFEKGNYECYFEFEVLEKVDLNLNDNEFDEKFDIEKIKKDYIVERFSQKGYIDETRLTRLKKIDADYYKKIVDEFNDNKENIIYRWKIQHLLIMAKNANTINNMFVLNTLKFNETTQDFEIKNIKNKDYEINNKIPNACFYDVLIQTYKNKIENLMINDKKVYSFKVNYESLYELFNGKCENEIELKIKMNNDMGLTFSKAKIFFEKFSLNLLVLDINNNVLYEYQTTSVNTHVFPQTLKLIYHNNHVYQITEEKKFNKIKDEILNNEELFVNDNFHTKYNVEKNVIILNEETIIDDIKKMQSIIHENKNIKDKNKNEDKDKDAKVEKNFVFVSNKSLLLYHNVIRDTQKHEITVNFNENQISMLCSKFDDKKSAQSFTIINPFKNDDHDMTNKKIDTIEYYNEFYE